MDTSFLLTSLLIVSLLTNLTVEAMKKILDGAGRKYSSNILAVIVACITALLVSVGYMILNDISFTFKIGVQVFIIIYMSFLTSTVGYDKVKQMISQLHSCKGDDL